MYIEINKLPSTASKQQFANHFFSNQIVAISLDSHNEDEKGPCLNTRKLQLLVKKVWETPMNTKIVGTTNQVGEC
jgi:hypothetical protein